MNCIFCDIVAGRAEASVVHEDNDVMAFMDIRPWTAGHLLVVPKRHAAGLAELDLTDGQLVFAAGQKIAKALRRDESAVEGVNLFLADGAVAGQEVFHVHLHVVPRTRGDSFGLRGVPRSPDRVELDRTADRIKPLL